MHSANQPSKPLAVFDIDRTLTKEFLITPIIESEEKAGLLPKGSYRRLASILARYKNGELDYEVAIHDFLVTHARTMTGGRYADFESHSRDFLASHRNIFRSFGAPVLGLLSFTHQTILVTAEPAYMAQAVADAIGASRILSTEYAVDKGIFTGKVATSLAHRDEKRRIVGTLKPDFAFGDSAGDIEMLDHAHFPYCISPDIKLTAEAEHKGWKIFSGDSDADNIILDVKSRLEFDSTASNF